MPRTHQKINNPGLYLEDDILKNRDRVLMAQINKLVDEVTELKTALAEHVHGGVTAGEASTDAPDTITYANAEADYVE
jgi:hypothetical protein